MSPRLLGECSAWLDVYAASIGVGAELALRRGGPAAALALVEDAREYARHTERPALARFLSALRVWVLLDGDDVDEAVRAWRFDRLPELAAECLDLQAQSWREVEMLACARLRLFIASCELDAGREFGAALQAVAAERTLVRTRMRGLALSVALEHRAGARPTRRRRIWLTICGCSPRRTMPGRSRVTAPLLSRCSTISPALLGLIPPWLPRRPGCATPCAMTRAPGRTRRR